MKRMNKLTNNHGRGSGLILIVAAIIAVLVATQLGGLGAGGETKKQQEQIQQDAVNTAQDAVNAIKQRIQENAQEP